MKMKRIWKDNKGAALILVVGCVALLSVIGSMLLLVTANNREMKKLEEQMQNTFYQAESGSNEMLSALEVSAEMILEDAFSDMLIQYSALTDDAAREARIAEYFETALMAELNDPDGASNVMSEALGGMTLTSVQITGDVESEASSDANKTDVIKINGVTFTYEDGEGNASTITTDITVQSGIPNVENALTASSARSDYTDFALITNGSIHLNSGMGTAGQSATIGGNMYTAGNVNITAENATLQLKDAEKALVKGTISVKSGSLKVDNTSKIDSGYGVWADGIEVLTGGTVEGVSNFYIADDLAIEGDGGKVILSGAGTEYVGYSGNTSTMAHNNSSAITINNVENVTIDLSNMKNLILNGMSYIYDKKWTGGNPILQGESVAYKDMQTMYLAPAAIIGQSNPVLKSKHSLPSFTEANELDYYYNPASTGDVLSLANYINLSDPFITRNVILDGGATEFTYSYLKFESQAKARDYVREYLASALGNDIRARITNLGTSKIVLAQNNYTAGTIMEYVDGALTFGNLTDTGSFFRSQSSSTAKKRHTALFSSLRLNNSTAGTVDDLLTKTVLSDGALERIVNTANNRPTGDGFWAHTGDVTLDGVQMEGIILVNGNLTITGVNTDIKGLVIATGEVKFDSEAKLTADKDVVENLLLDPAVAAFFRVESSAEGADEFISREAVNVKFENWQRN